MSLPTSPPTQFTTPPPQEDGHASRLVAALNPHCLVCGHQNPHGLQINFLLDVNCVTAEWVPGETWESFQGVIHGGMISTVLDEAMSKAIIADGLEAFTVDLRVRFKRKLNTGEAVQIRGWVIQQRKRKITAEASLCTADGEHAHAWGVFLIPPRSSGVANGIEPTAINIVS